MGRFSEAGFDYRQPEAAREDPHRVDQPIAVAAAGSRLIPVRLQVAAEAGKPGSNPIELIVQSSEPPVLVRREKSTFMLPR